MPDLPISGLPAATAVDPGDLVPIVQGGNTKKATVEQLFGDRETVTLQIGAVSQILQQRSNAYLTFDDTSPIFVWTDVPGSSLTFTLDADCLCWLSLSVIAGATLTASYQVITEVTLTIDGVQQSQAILFAFQSPDVSGEFEVVSGAVEQYVLSLTAGSHTIKMQARLDNALLFPGDGFGIVPNRSSWVLLALSAGRDSSVTVFSSYLLDEDESRLLLEDGSPFIME